MRRLRSALTDLGPLRWLLLAGFVLRLARPEIHSFWIDEGSSVMLARGPDLLEALRHDSHPPLSFLVWRGWGALFGWSDLALRSLPALVSCVSLCLFVPLARSWLGRERANWAVAAYAFSPLLVWIGHEVRIYAFVELATLLILLAARAAWRRGHFSGWAALAACMALATGLHYYASLAGLIVVAQALVRRFYGTLTRTQLVRTLAACALGVGVWIPWFLTILPAQYTNEWPRIARFTWRDVAETPARLFAVDLIVLDERGIAWLGWVLGALCVLGLGLWACRAITRSLDRERLDGEPVAGRLEALCAALVPIGAALVLAALLGGGFQPRYLITAVPGTIACVAAGLTCLRPVLLARSASVALLACALTLCVLQLAQNRREDYRTVCREIAERWRPGDRLLAVVCVPEPYVLATVDHYLEQRPEVLASLLDTDRYLSGAERLPSGTRIHVIWREATICWEPLEALRRTHRFLEEAPPRFRIHRILAQAP